MRPFAKIIVGLLLLAGTPALPIPGTLWTQPTPGPAPAPTPAPVSPSTVTAAVYVYEKDDGPIPPGVAAGIDRLNRERKIVASLFEDDTVDGTGETPDQYKPALAAAKSKCIPSLVVLAGTNAIKVVDRPKTADDVVGAVP